jgi:hypothetical protein
MPQACGTGRGLFPERRLSLILPALKRESKAVSVDQKSKKLNIQKRKKQI